MNYLDTRLKDIQNGYIQHFGILGMKWGWTKDGKRTGAKEAMTEQEIINKRLEFAKKNYANEYNRYKNYANQDKKTKLGLFGFNKKNHNMKVYEYLKNMETDKNMEDAYDNYKKMRKKKENIY